MKVVILAGGFGNRIHEETVDRPKPMVEIGGMPILWHIMKLYSWYGHNEFIICLGYKKEFIVEYFKNSFTYIKKNDVDNKYKNSISFYSHIDDWKITLVDTGINTNTGGRLKAVKKLINNETFLMSYGDTLSDVNINKVIKLHKAQKATGTLTTVQPRCAYGVLKFNNDKKNMISSFKEKPIDKEKWINAGFYVFEPGIFKYLNDDSTSLEQQPLETIAKKNQLAAFKHKGFWKSIETYKDKLEMEELWENKTAKWNVWEEHLRDVL